MKLKFVLLIFIGVKSYDRPGCIRGWERRSRRLGKTTGHWSGNCGYAHESLHDCKFQPSYDCGNQSIWTASPKKKTLLVYYGGQLGNNMFQYAFATRLSTLFQSANLITRKVATEEVPRWSRMKDVFSHTHKEEKCFMLITDRDGISSKPMCAQLQSAVQNDNCNTIKIDGFFQDFRAIAGETSAHQKARKLALRQAFAPNEDECPNTPEYTPSPQEIVVHLRMCTYTEKVKQWPACYGELPYEYYQRILKNEKNITILTPPSCLKNLNAPRNLVKRLMTDFGAKLRNAKSSEASAKDGRSDYCYLYRAHRIVLQPSTFGWWAAWLSMQAKEIHFPLIGLFAHQRTLNYPRGPTHHPTDTHRKMLKCDGLFQAPGGTSKSLVVPEDRYIYHDVLGDRWFGAYAVENETFSFLSERNEDDDVGSTYERAKSAFCADPPVRNFKKSNRIIALGPRSVQLMCFAKWTEAHTNTTSIKKVHDCCSLTDKLQPKMLLFPRSHIEAAMHFTGGNILLSHTVPNNRSIDFNFIGRVHSKQAAATRARRWILDFAKSSFTNASYYLDTTATHQEVYKKLAAWDFSAGTLGFLPMDAMAKQKNGAHCAMAKCDPNYYATLASSLFTLAPAGDQPWSQRFFEAIMAASIPIVQSAEHTGRSFAEKTIGYKYFLVSEFSARLAAFRKATKGAELPLPYCASIAKHNLDLFLRHQSLITRRQSITPGLFLCESEAFSD